MTHATRWESVRSFVLVAAGVALVAIVLPHYCRSPLLEPGTQAPAFSLERLDRPGEHVTLGDLRGRRSVLFFWAVWCPACERMLPGLADLARSRPDVLFVAVHSDGQVDPRAVARRASSWRGPLYATGGDRVMGSYRATSFPTTYVIGSDGRVCGGFSGARGIDAVSEALDACR